MDKSIRIVPYKLTWKGKIIAITSEDSMINLHNRLNKVCFRENVNMDSEKNANGVIIIKYSCLIHLIPTTQKEYSIVITAPLCFKEQKVH